MKVVEIAKRFVKDERGLETVEYAVIAGLIISATIVTIGILAGYINIRFQALTTALTP